MFILADRVKQSSITTGTGDIVFDATFPSFQPFADAIGDGNSTYYAIEMYSKYEIGIGTYTSSTNSLSRDIVLESSNSDAKIDLDGVSIVFCTYPAEKAFVLDDAGFATGFDATYAGIKFPDGTTQNSASTGGGNNGGGDSTRSHISVNSSTTLATTAEVVFISTLSSDIEVTLPFASGMQGKTISFKFNSNQYKCTILSQTVDDLDSSSSTALQYKNESISCFSDGDDWYIL
jgi:hypothetical protein